MTFLQAKYNKDKFLNGGRVSFKGDFFQYELLSTRPNIRNNSSKFNFPNDILSFSNFDSIGSFGVFFKDAKGLFDMAYAAAKDLSTKHPSIQKIRSSRVLYFPSLNTNSSIFKLDKNKLIELRATLNINCFIIGLLNFLIGGEFIRQRSIVQFLKSYFKGRSETTSIQFLDYLNENSEFGPSDNSKVTGLGNVLLVNIDERSGQ